MKLHRLILLLFLGVIITSNNAYSQAQATRHDFVKRDNKASDMAVGDYTVLATSTLEADAKKIAEEIKQAGDKEVSVGYLSAKQSWFVFVKAADVEKARAARDKYRKAERFRDAWILTVHE